MSNQHRLQQLSNRLSQVGAAKPQLNSPKLSLTSHRIQELHDEIRMTADSNSSQFTALSLSLNRIAKLLHKERETREILFEAKAQELEQTHESLKELLCSGLAQREETDAKLLKFLNDKVSTLRAQITEEAATRSSELQHMHIALASALPTIEDRARSLFSGLESLESALRSEFNIQTQKTREQAENNRKAQEQNEAELQKRARELARQLATELAQERREREHSNEQLLGLLEESCCRLESS